MSCSTARRVFEIEHQGRLWALFSGVTPSVSVKIVGLRLAGASGMRFNLVPALFLLAASSISPALLAAERVAVFAVSGGNVHPAYEQIAQDLFKDYLADTGKYSVVDVPAAAAAPSDPTQAVEAGRLAGADLVLLVRLTHLQNSFRIRLTAYQVATKAMVHSDTLGSTGGPDELDPVVSRLVKAFAKGERAGTNAEIDTVTQKEADPYLKETATKTFGLRLGAILPFNRPRGDIAAGPGLGLFWMYDAREYMAEIFVDFVSTSTASAGNSVRAFDVGLGLYRPFSRTNVVPYAGGGVAYSVSSFGGDGANGLRFHGAFGVLFGRLSTVQLRGEIGYFVNAYQEAAYSASEVQLGASNTKSLSHGPMLMAGIGF
jgi:hypothetical protein